MKAGQKSRSGLRESKRPQRLTRAPLAAHRAFAPLLGVWGASLGAGVVLVLPTALVEQLLVGTAVGTWGNAAQMIVAGTLAALLGILLFALAALRHVVARRLVPGPSLARLAVRRVTPIDPARDLGSLRLDDPVDTMPFSTPAWRDAYLDDPQPRTDRELEPQLEPGPRELDLAQFSELSQRDDAWSIEPARLAAAMAGCAAPPPPQPAPGTGALARLRAVRTSELSLAEMLERIAGALEEVREVSPDRSLAPADLAAREAALAEALKALEALGGKGRPAPPRLPRHKDAPLAARSRLRPHFERIRGAA